MYCRIDKDALRFCEGKLTVFGREGDARDAG